MPESAAEPALEGSAGRALLEQARSSDPSLAELAPVRLAAAIRELLAAGDVADGLELLGRLGRRFSVTNELEDGASVAADALAAAMLAAERSIDVDPWRTRVLCFDGLYAFRQGDGARSLARNTEALEIARSTDDVLGQCEAITGLARLALRDGNYRRVVEMTTEARRAALAAGDMRAAAAPLHLLAAGTRLLGEHRAARELYLESLDLNRQLGNAGWVSMEQQNLGWVELHLGDADAASAWFEAVGTQGDVYRGAWAELQRAGVALVRGDRPAARARLAAGTETLARLGAVADPDDQSELDWLRAELETEPGGQP